MPAAPQPRVPHRGLRQGLRDSFVVAKVNIVPQHWVPHLRDGCSVDKVGIVRSMTALTHNDGISKVEVAY
jgi:hypothetical protein